MSRSSSVPHRRLVLPPLIGVDRPAFAAAATAQRVALRVKSTSPWLVVIVDDRSAPLVDEAVEGLQRVLAVALGLRHLELRRLSDEPAWRRDAVWARALRPEVGA